jgi:hypothetical protein
MKRSFVFLMGTALVGLSAGFGLAVAQTDTTPPATTAPVQSAPATAAPAATTPAAPATGPGGIIPPPVEDPNAAPAASLTPPANAVLELKALDKITGKASVIMAPLNKPVKFATLTITARTCYSTPPSETPETSGFLQITDKRPDQPERKAFSGWMYASSPGLNSLQHPLYDVWVISCITNVPGHAKPSVLATAPVKPVSPNAGANEAMPTLPEDAGQ